MMERSDSLATEDIELEVREEKTSEDPEVDPFEDEGPAVDPEVPSVATWDDVELCVDLSPPDDESKDDPPKPENRNVLRDGYMAMFGEEPLRTDAFEKVVKRYWIVAIVLVIATAVKVLDTVSDVLVTVNWWRNDGQENSRRDYARFSAGILAVSTGVSLGFSVFGASELQISGSWFIVILFFLFHLNVEPWTVIVWLDVWTGRKPPEAVFKTVGLERSFGENRLIWKFLKGLEFILEAAPEITLQSYVAAFEFFDDDKSPSLLLQLSIAVSVLSIAAGVATTYLCYETFRVQIWGTFFFAGALVARIAICVFAFVEFGHFAMIFVGSIVALRLAIFAHMSGWRVFSEGNADPCSIRALLLPLFLLVTLPALVIELFVPLGFRSNINDARTTVFWGSFNPRNGLMNTQGIAYLGQTFDTQGVRSRLESPLAFIMIALHIVENLVMLVIIAVLPHRAQRAQVGLVPLVEFVVVPMLVAVVPYAMVLVKTKDLETKWTTALDVIVVRLQRGESPLPMEFKDMDNLLQALFGDDKTPTVARCDDLKRRIHSGTLYDLDARQGLDLLLLGNARLRVDV